MLRLLDRGATLSAIAEVLGCFLRYDGIKTARPKHYSARDAVRVYGLDQRLLSV